jgi:formate dehydrogenase major subunit
MTQPIQTLSLDGRDVEIERGETLWALAKRHGTHIPHLCHTESPGLEPVGNCRACMVEVDGERTLAASCCRAAAPGMKVKTASPRARAAQQMVLELLMSDAGASTDDLTLHSELSEWAVKLGAKSGRLPRRAPIAADHSHPAIAVNLDACIQCTRCLRACRDVQVNDVIGLAGRGAHARIVFDAEDALGASTCVACGECVQACPTGALMPAQGAGKAPVAREVNTVCPYCGVGCQVTLHVGKAPDKGFDKLSPNGGSLSPNDGRLSPNDGRLSPNGGHRKADKIHFVTGRNGPANQGRLCVKGRYGFDYVRHGERLETPLVRRDGVAKDARDIERVKRGELALSALFREATWDEALDLAAAGLARIRDTAAPHEKGPHARLRSLPPEGARQQLRQRRAPLTSRDSPLAGFGSAKGSNEEAYLFQKLVRTGFRTNNVDHCTRLCHASSVAALLEGIGSGAVSNPVQDVQYAEVVLLIGANPSSNHPVAASFIKNAVKRGTKLIVADPRATPMTRHAKWHLAFKPDTDVALLSAMLNVIITEGLVDQAFVRDRVEGFDALVPAIRESTPEKMAAICGIPAQTLREVARAFATSKASMILWGMGISQHVHGTDNARCLIALSLVTGQIGRPGTGLHPLRGQNNVQGASDAGLIPMMFPNYQRVSEDDKRMTFEALWKTKLDPKPGLTVVEIMHAASEGRIRGMFVEGENPAMSDPDLDHARKALAGLEHLVVQDIFPTETAILADVVLPGSAWYEKWGTVTNTDRLIQIGRPALVPSGQAKQDLWIIEQIARRIGLDWTYWQANDGDGHEAREAPVARVYEEMRSTMEPLKGVPWSRLIREDAVMTPADDEDHPGHAVVFIDRFPRASGRALIRPAHYAAGPEQPHREHPLVLSTGRVLEHWHTGSMTRRSQALHTLSPDGRVSMNELDAKKRRIRDGDRVRVSSHHGAVELVAEISSAMKAGEVFIPFAFWESPANRLTGDAIDPDGKIPGFKVTAVEVEAVA